MAARIATAATLVYLLVFASWHGIDAANADDLTAAWTWLAGVMGDVAALAFCAWLWLAKP